MADAMESDLPGKHRDVLEAVYQQVTSGIQGYSGIVCCQLKGLQLLCQGYNKRSR